MFYRLVLAILIWTIGVIASKLTAKTLIPGPPKIFLRSLAYQDFYYRPGKS
jgi:uncharacterized membrane protein YeiB